MFDGIDKYDFNIVHTHTEEWNKQESQNLRIYDLYLHNNIISLWLSYNICNLYDNKDTVDNGVISCLCCCPYCPKC